MDKPKPKSYKRVKKVYPCANPLFEKWLTEWRDEAQKKGWKMHRTYSKALTSLKKYPVPLQSGKEAKMLEFFGDKICKMLDDKLTKHHAEHGEVNSEYATNGDCSADPTPIGIENNTDAVSPGLSPAPKKRRVPTTREYVPVVRSGAYALLMTLYNNHCQNGPQAFMKKIHLMEAAQHLSDKSFKIPETGSFYTAWNSMSTLIRKSLVMKEGSPARYSLTGAAMELAERLSAAQQTTASTSSQESQQSSSLSLQSSATTGIASSQESMCNSQSSVNSTVSGRIERITTTLQSCSVRFEYCYVSESDTEVREKDRACVNIDDNMIGFLIKCKKDDLLRSGKCFQIDTSRPALGDYIYVYLHNNHAEEFSPLDPSVYLLPKIASPLLPAVHSSAVATLPTDNAALAAPVSVCSNGLAFTVPLHVPKSTSNSMQSGEKPVCVTTSSTTCVVQNPVQFTLEPGQFDVILCVDNCETISGNVNSRKLAVQNDLRKNGVNFDVRKLNVGDFVWIARERVTQIRGQLRLPQARELILDYVVERKRMDDLAGSIKDGRFHEQKFRLKNCGLQHPIYLVEEMASGTHYSMPEATLHQAVVNTMVIDKFIVKRTTGLAASVMYLTILTRYLQSIYSHKKLISCCKEDLPKKVDSSEVCQLMTFEEFNSLCVKNKELVIKDLFVKHLLQLSGLSVDKTSAVVERYPTPCSLIAAYSRCSTQIEKEKLLADIKFGKALRKLGPAISKSVYQLYCQQVLC